MAEQVHGPGGANLATDAKLDTLIAAVGNPEGAWTEYTSSAREKTAIVKATGGTLHSFLVNLATDAGATLYVQAHDAASGTAVSTGTLKFPFGPITPGDTKVIDPEKMTFTNGIKLVLSTAEDTYAAPASDKGFWHALKA